MDFNIDVRKKQLQSLDQYITSSKDKVQSILDYLEWNSKKVVEKEPEVICSVNPSHVVAAKSADVHSKKCFIKSSGYQSDDEFLSDPINDTSSSIQIDHSKKIEILNKARENNQRFRAAWNGTDSDPMTSNRLFTTFSTDERLALYDYCIQNTEPPPVPTEFNIQIEDKKETFLTPEQLLLKERDAKRRRIKYKSVHTGRSKSHTEVIREVIESQMEQYRDFLKSDMQADASQSKLNDQNSKQNLCSTSSDDGTFKIEAMSDIERPSSSISRHSNHSGSSRVKKDYSKQDKLYKNHSYETDYKADRKVYDKRYEYSSKYDSPRKDYKRHKGFEDDYKYSRERRYHKSERRH